MKKIFSILLVLIIVWGCEVTKKVTENNIHDDNQDGIYIIPNNSVLGPTEVNYSREGRWVLIVNNSGTHMGIDFRPKEGVDAGIPLVAKSFISQGGSEVQSGLIIDPPDRLLKVTSVFYNPDLGGLIIQAIQLMGLDFITQLDDWMVDSSFEALVRFSEEGEKIFRLEVSNDFLEKWKLNSQNNNFENWVLGNPEKFPEDFDFKQLWQEIDFAKRS